MHYNVSKWGGKLWFQKQYQIPNKSMTLTKNLLSNETKTAKNNSTRTRTRNCKNSFFDTPWTCKWIKNIPVNDKIAIFGLEQRRFPTSWTFFLLQGTMLTNPAGTPESWRIFARARVVSGVSSPGLTTHEQPKQINVNIKANSKVNHDNQYPKHCNCNCPDCISFEKFF